MPSSAASSHYVELSNPHTTVSIVQRTYRIQNKKSLIEVEGRVAGIVAKPQVKNKKSSINPQSAVAKVAKVFLTLDSVESCS